MRDNLPVSSVLHTEKSKNKHCYSSVIALKRRDMESWELISAFFQSSPAWVDKLFVLRNKIVGSLGLKTGAPKKTELKPPYHVGQKIGLFHVLAITDDEVVLGEDDKHLDFRVSLFVMKKNTEAVLIVSTLVKTKNLLGVMYFSVVKPIHLVIVPMMVREMAKRIDARPPLADRL